jgi:hypothetical protein
VTLCVYALVPAGTRPRGRGAADEPLRTIALDRVAAIVGELRRPLTPTPANLARYDAALGRLSAAVPAILPARFGTVVEADELSFILRSRNASLARALRHVRNRVQMTMRIMKGAGGRGQAAEGRGRGAGGRGRTDKRMEGRGADYLRERAARARDVPGFDPVRAAVRRWVRDEQVEKRERVVSIYHLVPRAAAGAYARAARAAAAAAGLRLTVSGPFPPYAFTEA